MFPTGFKGEFEIPQVRPQDLDAVLSGVAQELFAVKTISVRREGNRVTFRGGILHFVFNWSVLGPVGYGGIEVFPGDPGIVR